MSEKTIKTAKERKYETTVYFHECPYCDYASDDYETSIAGDILDCACGKKYKVVK